MDGVGILTVVDLVVQDVEEWTTRLEVRDERLQKSFGGWSVRTEGANTITDWVDTWLGMLLRSIADSFVRHQALSTYANDITFEASVITLS